MTTLNINDLINENTNIIEIYLTNENTNNNFKIDLVNSSKILNKIRQKFKLTKESNIVVFNRDNLSYIYDLSNDNQYVNLRKLEKIKIFPFISNYNFYGLAFNEMKMQKTPIGGGYHVWHWESSGRATSNRLLNYQIFLNDVEEGGETEFLYLHRREKAREGTLLIYPGNFTHTHRGNPPISNEKYIINGWIEF